MFGRPLFGYRVQITSLDGKHAHGRIEPGGYSFAAQIFDRPSEHGLDQGRINRLWIKDGQGRAVVEYDRGFARDAQGRPEALNRTQTQLIRAVKATFPDPETLSVSERAGIGLDRHKVIDRPEWRDRLPSGPLKVPPGPPVKPTVPLQFGRLTVHMPADCPDRPAFERVCRDQLQQHFDGDTGRAARAHAAYAKAQIVPEKFKVHPAAVNAVRREQVERSPEASGWERFTEEFSHPFHDTDAYEGRRQDQAIPGWEPDDAILITVAEERSMAPGFDASVSPDLPRDAGKDSDLGR